MIIVNSRFLTHKITGVQRYSIEISKQLMNMSNNIDFVTPKDIEQTDLSNLFNAKKIGNLKGHLWEQFELPPYLSKNKNPLLLSMTNTAPVFYKNKIVTIHDTSSLNDQWVSKKFKYFYKCVMPQIINNSLKIVTVSDFSKQEITKYFNIPENKIEVIYNAVSQEFINLTNEHYENKYGNYILAVSSINPRKNFKNLILAFNKLKLKDTKLLIVGAEFGIYKNPELKTLINDNSDILFTGYVSDKELAGLYKNAKLFVFPSLYEGFGIPPLEAMACGCPTLVSNISSIPEVCGNASHYIDPYDINSIASGIYTLLNDNLHREELINNGYARVKQFTWKDSALKYIDLINRV